MNYKTWTIDEYYKYFRKAFIYKYNYSPNKIELDKYINSL